MKCKKCGESLECLSLKAIFADLGVRVYPSPLQCIDDGEHDFSKTEDEIAKEYREHDPDERWPGKNMGD